MNTPNADFSGTDRFNKKPAAGGLYAPPLILFLLLAHTTTQAEQRIDSPSPVITPSEQEQELQDKQRLQEKINRELEDNRKRVLEQSQQNKKVQGKSESAKKKNSLKGK